MSELKLLLTDDVAYISQVIHSPFVERESKGFLKIHKRHLRPSN